MEDSKNLIVKKENYFIKIINKIKSFFIKNKEYSIQEKGNIQTVKEYNEENNKNKFLDNIKVESHSEILSLKVKLDNGEVRAIDLTDEQIDELQEIYNKEIAKKKEIIKKTQSVT